MAENLPTESSPLEDPVLSNKVAKSEEKPSDGFKFHRVAKHAPASSHGTYLKQTEDGLEELEYYEEGGYHPVHLQDCFSPDDRYRVIHKLGSGGYATVWLCRDVQEMRYVALKILTADTPVDRLVELSFSSLDQTAPGAKLLAIPLDHFTFNGPNGTHQCIVLPVLGPCSSPRIWTQFDDPAPVLRSMCKQAVQGLQFLHENGICHGDFRPANILLRLGSSIDHLDEDGVLSLLGEPGKFEVAMESGSDVPPTTPAYLVAPANLEDIGAEYLCDEICIIDLGEAFRLSSPRSPLELGIPEHYLPPEVIFNEEDSVGPGCDLWALACTLYEIRAQIPLFYMMNGEDDLVSEMTKFFGELPRHWWEKWEGRGRYFNEDGSRISRGYESAEVPEYTLEVALSCKVEMGERSLEIPAEEQRLLADLLRRICDYDPQNRPSVTEVLGHEWFGGPEDQGRSG